VNTNNGVKWRRFIVPKKVEHINDHLLVKQLISIITDVKVKKTLNANLSNTNILMSIDKCYKVEFRSCGAHFIVFL